MKLLVGLGNPGKKYTRTRHNVGFLALDALLPDADWRENTAAQALVVKTELGSHRVIALKPTTFMNNSGVSVAHIVKKNNLDAGSVIVLHDDKDIPLGTYRVQTDRGAAGHNGVLSIIEHLGTKNFTRIRIGVAPADGEPIPDTAQFVLAPLTSGEQKILHGVYENIKNEIENLLAP